MELLAHIFPFWYDQSNLRTISVRLEVQVRKMANGELDGSWVKYRSISVPELKEALKSEFSRRDAMQRRALAFLAAIAIASAFSFGAITYFRAASINVRATLGTSVVVTIVYLVVSVWNSLKIVEPNSVFDLSLQTRMDGEKLCTEDELKDRMLILIQLNQAQLLVYSVYSVRAYRCLRNGALCILFSLLVIFVDTLISSK